MKRHPVCSTLLWFLVERGGGVSSFCCPPSRSRGGVTKTSTFFLLAPPRQKIVQPTFQRGYSSAAFSPFSSNNVDNETQHPLSIRSKMRQITGFSLTALRATIRGITGISMSGVVSNTIRRVLDVLRPGIRWVIQPLLILYYAPILILRYYVVGPTQQYVEDSRSGHQKLVDGWRKAVKIAEKAHADGYWPVHLNGE